MNARSLVVLVSLLVCGLQHSPAQSFLDALDEALSVSNANQTLRADLSFLGDFEVYVPSKPAPGLLFSNDDTFVNPRLGVFLDIAADKYVQLHAQMRVDRGFDPGSAPDGDVRLDEYYLRLSPLGDDRLNIQAGKFATVFGNWTSRHLSWDNPFVNAPLPYEDVLAMSDRSVPSTPAAMLNRRNIADKKADWLPLLWGPSYASGLSISGRLDWFDYAMEIKNASISSRPDAWDLTQRNFDHPTFTTRLGARPSPEWSFGTSFSHGSYLLDEARRSADQTTFGLDAGYQHHHWQLWGEVMYSNFEVPNVGDAECVFYYLEAKYKLTAQLFAALRWNQSFFGDVADGSGGSAAWDRDAWRVDLALGCRLSRHVQAKVQYSVGDKHGTDAEGNHLLATQLTVRF